MNSGGTTKGLGWVLRDRHRRLTRALALVAALSTPSCGKDPVKPLPSVVGPPTGFAAVGKVDHKVSLTWGPPTYGAAVTYVVRASTSGYPKLPTDGRAVYEGSAQAWTDTGLTPNRLQYYAIFCRTADGIFSNPAKASALPDWSYREETFTAATLTERWLTSHLNDCEFGGHGPRVTFNLTVNQYKTSTYRYSLSVSITSLEWTGPASGGSVAGDGTTGTVSFETPIQDTGVTTDWVPYQYVVGSTTTSTLDGLRTINARKVLSGHGYHDISDIVGPVGRTCVVVGDTDGGDVCGQTEDDTHLHSLSFRTITVKFRR